MCCELLLNGWIDFDDFFVAMPRWIWEWFRLIIETGM